MSELSKSKHLQTICHLQYVLNVKFSRLTKHRLCEKKFPQAKI
jgi:hypothetical protein